MNWAKYSKKKKILLGILGIILIVTLCFTIYGFYIRAKVYPQKIEVKSPAEPNGKEVLVVYQPAELSNDLEKTAYKIANGAIDKGAKVTLIRPTKSPKVNVDNFDAIVFGTPWYFGPSYQLVDFMKGLNNISDKEVYLFMMQGGPYNASWRFDDLKKHLKEASVAGTAQFENVRKTEFNMAVKFGEKIGSNK